MDVSIIALETPFRTAFVHARAKRKSAAAVLVRVRDADGVCGYGEGCPRDYVTGETLEGAMGWLKANAPFWLEHADGLASLKAAIRANEREIDANPSAFCALELALLDQMARRNGQSVEALLGLTPCPPLKVTAVLGSDSALTHALQTLRFKQAGLTEAKLKLGPDAKTNLNRARSLSRRFRLRLDGNNLWPDAKTAIAALKPLTPFVWAVEEPIGARNFEGLRDIHAATGLSVILDESLITRRDLEASGTPQGFIANLRVSKLGGLIRSLEMLDTLMARGIGVIVGAQVGETSLLARAGLVLAGAAGELAGYEGGYGTHLLAQDGFSPEVRFSKRGVMDLSTLGLAPFGFGVAPTAELTAQFDGAPSPR